MSELHFLDSLHPNDRRVFMTTCALLSVRGWATAAAVANRRNEDDIVSVSDSGIREAVVRDFRRVWHIAHAAHPDSIVLAALALEYSQEVGHEAT